MDWYASDNNLCGTPRFSLKNRMRAGRPHAVSGWLMLIHTCHAHVALCRGLKKLLSERQDHGMAWLWHGTCESNTHCIKQIGKKHSKPLAARHGTCELALKVLVNFQILKDMLPRSAGIV
jgi:hypothetical protein